MSEPSDAPLEPPDSHTLRAAEGWHELGDHNEALAELAGLSEESGRHPDTLQVKCAIYAAREEWSEARDVANDLVEIAPGIVAGWIHRAYATRRMPGGSIQAAWLSLHPAANLFPKEPIIPYNLSCYECQLGRLSESRSWLQRALAIIDSEPERKLFKKMALGDRDLEPIWTEIKDL